MGRGEKPHGLKSLARMLVLSSVCDKVIHVQ